ncbi:MAG: diguanylate cyclase with sensor [Xanthobacteraceae bacterium]|nr:diguanylate cyclase with sensor [Xanthobacteraceae bacterium]
MSDHALPSDDEGPVAPEAAFAAAPVALCVIGPDHRLRAANKQMAELIGLPAQELICRPVDEVLPDAVALVQRWLKRATAGLPIAGHELTLPETGRTYLAAACPLHDAQGGFAGLSVALTDVTNRRMLRTGFAQRERRIGFALQNAGQWVWELDIAKGRVYRSPHWKMTLGYDLDEATEEDEHEAWSIVHPDDKPMVRQRFDQVLSGRSDVFEAVYRVRDKFGRWRWILGRGRIAEWDAEGRPLRLLATSVDISRQKQIEEELAATVRQREQLERELIEANRRLTELSEMDPLTELPNRRKFDSVLAREIGRTGRHKPSLALMMIDVDGFKHYNDLYGHIEGDECLRKVAETLRHCSRRTGDVITRYGGEEFAVVLADTDETDAVTVATSMLRAVRDLRVAHAGSPYGIVTVSVGIAIHEAATHDTTTPPVLVANADRALYAAKQAGRNCILVARPDGGAMRVVLAPEGGVGGSSGGSPAPPGTEVRR